MKVIPHIPSHQSSPIHLEIQCHRKSPLGILRTTFRDPADGKVKHQQHGRLSGRLSGLLHELGRDAGARQTYQQSIVSFHRLPDSRLLIDGTSVSTYGGLDDWAAYGHNRDGEHLPQINIQFAVMEPGTIPVALRMVEGSVPDVSTLLNTLEEMKAFAISGVRATLDRGSSPKAISIGLPRPTAG